MRWGVIVAGLVLAGCQSATQQYEDEDHLWVRTDGQEVSKDPALQAQGKVDLTVCIGEVQKSAVGAPIIYYQGMAGAISAAMIADSRMAAFIDILKGCMAQRGYVLAPRSQADAVLAGFRRQ